MGLIPNILGWVLEKITERCVLCLEELMGQDGFYLHVGEDNSFFQYYFCPMCPGADKFSLYFKGKFKWPGLIQGSCRPDIGSYDIEFNIPTAMKSFYSSTEPEDMFITLDRKYL